MTDRTYAGKAGPWEVYTGEGNYGCDIRGSSSFPYTTLVLLPVSSVFFKLDNHPDDRVATGTIFRCQDQPRWLLLLAPHINRQAEVFCSFGRRSP